MTNLLVGTTNRYKAELYRDMLGNNATIFTPGDLSLNLNVEEDPYDIVGNSQLKAKTFAAAANMMTISDDSGIFIPALGGQPGVAARRWGGELPATTTDEEWIDYYQTKVATLEDDQLAVTRRQVITLAHPNGEHRTLDFVTSGELLRERAQQDYPAGGPFAVLFKVAEFNKPEIHLTPEEKALFMNKIQSGVLNAVRGLIY